jgi:hypothetical protein
MRDILILFQVAVLKAQRQTMSTRSQNENKFGQWDQLPDGGRRYRRDVPGRQGWLARYFKDVDADETTVRFWQEIYDDRAVWPKLTRNCREH